MGSMCIIIPLNQCRRYGARSISRRSQSEHFQGSAACWQAIDAGGMADPLALLARLKRESALLESVTESRTSAPDTALGAVEIDDQLVVSTLIRLKAEHGAQRTIKPQHVRAALALAGDPAFARDPSIKIEAARWAALGVPRGDARSRVKSYAAGVVKLDVLKNVPKDAWEAARLAAEARRAALEAQYKRQYGKRWWDVMTKSLGSPM